MKLMNDKVVIIPGKERALITQITINHCKDILRSSWRKRNEPLNNEILFEDKQDYDFYNIVMSLPDKYRIVVFLHYYEGYTFAEIAAFLKISASAVSMRLHRAREALKKLLKESNDG